MKVWIAQSVLTSYVAAVFSKRSLALSWLAAQGWRQQDYELLVREVIGSVQKKSPRLPGHHITSEQQP